MSGGPAIESWLSASHWEQILPEITQKQKDKEKPQAKQWYYSQNGETYGPLSKMDLIDAITPVTSRSEVLLWIKGMKDWASVFEFHEIVKELGINHRKMPRADILGQVFITEPSGTTHIAQLTSISEGGFGAKGLQNLSSGQIVDIEMKSDKFFFPVRAKAEVRYVSKSTHAGFQFTTISVEARSAIVEYIKSSTNRRGENAA